MDRLQLLRSHYGLPTTITSGHRSPRHSIEAAKAAPGTHSMGRAVDIACRGAEALEILTEALVDPMGDGLLLLRRAYQFFALTSSNTRFLSMDSASIFFFQRFESFSISQIHVAIFSAPPMEGRFGDVVLAANRIDSVVTIGMPQNAENLFGTMSLLLHQTTP